MKAKVYSQKQLIGTTDLKVGDKSMGGLFGDFNPTDFYYKNIQKTVWEFWKTDKSNYEKWHSLRLNIQLENGIFLFPQGGYTIDSIEELPNEPIQIYIAGVDTKIIDDFLTDPPRIFVEEPWSAIEIGQKIAFEDELRNEIGTTNKSFFDFLKKKTKHILSDADISGFCHDQRNDNVLFEIKKANFDKRFVLIHLTWKGKKEKEGYPKIKFYHDFDDFKYSKMNSDKLDWEY